MRLAGLILLIAALTACGSAGTNHSHVVSVAGSVGPLQVDESTRGQVLAYAGEPDAERQGHNGVRYDVLGYDCSQHPRGTSDYLIRCRTAFYLVKGRLGLFVTHDRRYSDNHHVRIGMPTAQAQRLLGRRVHPGCADDIYLHSKHASLTVDFAVPHALMGGHVDAFALHSWHHDPGVTDCL